MKTNIHSLAPDNASKKPVHITKQQIEAARYVVLRRLTPSLRHHLVRPLQPIDLINNLMSHKLGESAPDLQMLRQQVRKIDDLATSALAQCVDISTWLAPESGIPTELAVGIDECISLMATSLHFCGFSLVNEIHAPSISVDRDALRMVLVAALFEMSDALTVPGQLTLSASFHQKEASLFLHFTAKAEGCVDHYDDGYRNVTWDDVLALATAGQVRLSRESNEIGMHFAVDSSAGGAFGKDLSQ